MALPKAQVLFGDSPEAPALSNAQVSERFDELMKALDSAPTRTLNQADIAKAFGEGRGISFENGPSTAYDALSKAISPEMTKAISPDALASITSALDALKAEQPDLMKDLTTTSPLSTGLVAYDLEAPAKMLTPRPTPLRNRLPRRKGIGLAHQFKVISGFTGTATGGVANIHPGIVDTTQTNFAPAGASQSLYYARGPKISYAGYDKTVAYSQFSVSDAVTWSAQYAGQGYQDIRQLSRTSLLYSSMLLEERMLLLGRGTSARNFLGALAAPTGLTVTARSAAGSETAITGAGANVYVKVTADAGDFGQSVLTAAVSAAVSAGQVVDVVATLPAGATGMRVYVSTGSSDPGDASRWYAGRAGYNTFTIQGALPTSGTAASAVTADTSAYTAGYDGILPICTGADSGYVNRLNAALSTSNPGSEWQTAFAALYDNVKADPDRTLLNGSDRKQLSDSLKTSSSSNYRMTITQDQLTGVTLGDVVNTIINEVTGKGVSVEVHPWMPQGNAPIISDTLPLPDSEVSDVWAVFNVQDMMGVDWPVTQFAFESSSYWMGALVCYAPAWNGAITGIKKA
ncbi:hypothetical protein ACFUEN_28840 [Streptomyces griseorubiginosus]|uniref:hypothetical protein n=1 Tax=Streptomyces griseorubiginosus TaxID=67304 RepID=UPI0036414B5E